MLLAKVIGNIWATRKYETLKGFKLMLIQPLNGELDVIGDPIIAADTVGAGIGEIVYYATSSESVIPLKVELAPVDASIVGIVDYTNCF